MTSLRITLSALAAAAVLAGCGSNVKLDENAGNAPVESRNPAGNAGGATGGAGQSGVATVDLGASRNNAGSNLPRVVYFDFDSFSVKDEYRNVIEVNAKALTADRNKRVAVEGHTDERGGSEYNLALGQKRAEAVARALTLLGANAAQVEATSFGKERPAVQGSDEAAYAQNRRAEIKDK
ncbi:peptidoglycan-associated lipoprotein Pal [uncultured Aquincola sp.]|uniref:peptidoglycan-associated lipoprotein Pal n=1 Tax=uncultured Aquincola sp. TaxID=886556 RepID=UPI0032B17A79